MLRVLLALLLACPAPLLAALDVDTDGDGLSDYQEQHKYFTDPARADSDGDGTPDGDWDERREYTYTLRTIVQVVPPVTPDVTNDDYQDARILDRTRDYVELEVIHYPLNTVAEGVRADPDWRAKLDDVARYLEPGRTANWDAELARSLRTKLAADGIDVDALDDRTLAERVSHWLCQHADYHDGFTTFLTTFDTGGQPRVYPGLEEAAERGQAEKSLSLEEQWERELFAKGMFEHGQRGSCTSSAIYLTGCLRAVGLPTRTILTVPLVDASDGREVENLVRIRHPRVRAIVQRAIGKLSNSWASHTFNEVWVGGRWVRLNYDRLGQNTLDPNLFGLITHVATLADWSDGEFAATVGTRQTHRPDDVFGGSNPYHSIALSDRFGEHSGLDPEALEAAAETDPEITGHRVLTIESVYWYGSEERAEGVAMRLDDPRTAGHVLVHVREHVRGGGRAQYREFYAAADHRFMLVSDDSPDVHLAATRGWWVFEDRGLREFYLRIAPSELEHMQPGVEYTLVTEAEHEGITDRGTPRWEIRDGLTLTRPE